MHNEGGKSGQDSLLGNDNMVTASGAMALQLPDKRLSEANLLTTMRNELHQLSTFIVQPRRGRPVAAPWREMTRRLLFLLALKLVFVLFIFFPMIYVLEKWAGITEVVNSTNPWRQLFLITLVAPVSEELLFRAGLRSALYTLCVAPIIITMFGEFWVGAALATCFILLFVVDQWHSRRMGMMLANRKKIVRGRAFLRWYPWVFWFYATAFGLVHISNLNFSGWSGFLVIFAVTSQIFGGLVLGYLRLRYSLGAAMMYHASFNLTVFCLGLLFPF
jgi:membrane protease YdiL (CAAX protease family)